MQRSTLNVTLMQLAIGIHLTKEPPPERRFSAAIIAHNLSIWNPDCGRFDFLIGNANDIGIPFPAWILADAQTTLPIGVIQPTVDFLFLCLLECRKTLIHLQQPAVHQLMVPA